MVLVHELARLGQRRRSDALGVLDDQLDLPARHLPVELVEVELGAVEHVLAEGRGGAGERHQEPDLDGTALGACGRRGRPCRREGEQRDEHGEASHHDGSPSLQRRRPRSAPTTPWGANKMTPM